jgi:hypothetical protein
MRIALRLQIGFLSLASTNASAQDSAALHQHAVEFIKQSIQPMPAGDTLLTWNGDRLVLFHTSSRDRAGVRGALLRADRMLGVADVRWQDRPQSFAVSWFTPRGTSIDSLIVRGNVVGNELRVRRSGHADSVVAIPTIRWAVADYGMDELLLPVLARASQDRVTQVAVLRPYGLKWDTLTAIESESRGRWSIARWTDQKGERWSMVILDSTRMVWLRRSDPRGDEELPLEGTALWSTFAQARSELERASRPRR